MAVEQLKKVLLFVCAIFFIGGEEAKGQTVSDEGRGIMKKAMDRVYSLEDQTADIIFTLQDDGGKQVKTELSFYWKNYRADPKLQSKTLLITTFPPTEKGESFLLWENKNPDDSEFWMYFPSLRQTRKIQRLSPEDGLRESDLLFEDMTRMQFDQTQFIIMKEGTLKGELCFIIQTTFSHPSPYGKKVFWISKKRGLILKIDYFSSSNQLLKSQNIQWQKIKEVPVWKGSRIKNQQTKRTTTIELKNIKINSGLPERIFTQRNLERGLTR
ncbi:MAG TPA: outer membrane lipoprotein-sorting protein [Nitrospiria bacterium]|jgi:outer membrane lipoprotein-sorting protein